MVYPELLGGDGFRAEEVRLYCKLFRDCWCIAGPVKDPLGNIMELVPTPVYQKLTAYLNRRHRRLCRRQRFWMVRQRRLHIKDGHLDGNRLYELENRPLLLWNYLRRL